MNAELKSSSSRALFAIWVLLAVVVVGNEARGEFRRPFGRFGLQNFPIFQPNVIQVLRQDNQGNTQDVGGFVNLAKQGNNLLLKDQFGRLFRPSFDQFGNLRANGFDVRFLGNQGNEMIRQLKEFTLQNLVNQNGNANAALVNNLGRNNINRFLFQNGVGNAIFGNVTIDLRSGVSKEYGNMKGQDCRVKARTLNFLLNAITDLKTRTLVSVNEEQACRQGFLSLNLRNIIRPELLALLVNENPRACGNPNAPIDLAWLVDRAMQPDIYYALNGIPKTLNEKAGRYGISPDKRQTAGNKVDVSGPPDPKQKPGDALNTESIVGLNAHRILEIQPTRNIVGGYCVTSFDNKKNNAQGAETDATDVFKNGINTTHVASEGFCNKANGFFAFDLYNVAGQIQQNAPADVALAQGSGRGLGQDVTAPVACMTCHDNGNLFYKDSLKTGKPYHDNLNNIPLSSRAFFAPKNTFDRMEQIMSTVYTNAIKASRSCVPRAGTTDKCEAVIPDTVVEFRKDLTVAQMAKEQGTTEAAMLAAINSTGVKMNKDGKVPRSVFSTQKTFCALQSAVGRTGGFGAGALGQAPQRGILQGGNAFRFQASPTH